MATTQCSTLRSASSTAAGGSEGGGGGREKETFMKPPKGTRSPRLEGSDA